MEKTLENSGDLVSYYLARVDHPQRKEQVAYTAECEDIIEVLQLNPDEANIFKEIWRTANERAHGKGKEGNNPLRAAQKLVHYSGRILRREGRNSKPKEPYWFHNNGNLPTPVEDHMVVVIFTNSTSFIGPSNLIDWDDPDILKWRYCE